MRKNYFSSLIAFLLVTHICQAQLSMDSHGNVSTGNTSIWSQKNSYYTSYGEYLLQANGDIYMPGGFSYWINSITDAGARLRLHNNGSNSYFDFYSNLYFRTGSSGSNYWPLTVTSSCYTGINNVSPQYPLDVTGTIRCTSLIQTSDSSLKENIKSLESPLSALLLLKGVTYNLKKPQPQFINSNSTSSSIEGNLKVDTTGNNPIQPIIDTSLYNRTHLGFIAQDLMKVYPQLVYKDKNGQLSVDYMGIIPLLVEALKQQQSQMVSMKQVYDSTLTQIQQNLQSCCNSKILKSTVEESTTPAAISTINKSTSAILYQNNPNPFNQSTQINYYLPESTSSATLFVYDMNGIQLKSFSIFAFGNGSLTINGNDLKPGMYFYSLIADGKEIDTKRMILTN